MREGSHATRPPSFPERLIGTGARGAGRLAGAAGIDRALEQAAEDAIVRALESGALERTLARVLESPATQKSLQRALDSEAIEQALARVLDSELVDHLWGRILASDEAQQLVERIARAPEVRSAIAAQSFGLLQDVGREVRGLTHQLDLVVERMARGLARRPRRATPTDRAGLFSRTVALAVDGLILVGAFLGVSALLALIVSAVDPSRSGVSAPLAAVGVVFWILVSATYLASFWALSGQTPGMRFVGLHLEANGVRRIGLRRAGRRLVWLVLATIPLGAGLWGVLFSDERRGLHDDKAATNVIYTPEHTAPWSEHVPAPARHRVLEPVA